MNQDCEFDKNTNTVEQNEKPKSRVFNDGVSSGENGRELNLGVSSMELDLVAPHSENQRSDDEVRVRVRVRTCTNTDDDASVVVRNDIDMDSRVFEVKDENTNLDRFELQNQEFDAESDKLLDTEIRVDGNVDLLSEFDYYVANEQHGAMLGTSRALSYGFQVGDMVWGKVKSHPWWPGHIFSEVFASTSVRRTRREGHVLVAFFGDSSYGWFDPAELIPFDLYFAEKSQQTNSRNFVKAVEEAMDEASRRCGLGLACKCRNPYNFRSTHVHGYFTVDVPDYEPNGLYSAIQIQRARDSFNPSYTLSFVKQLALAPQGTESIDFVKNKATVFAFRKAVFEEYDETYAQAFGVQPARPSHDPVDVKPIRAPLSGPLVIAEALGGGKSSKKPMKVKDHSKKEKYLFKRRDEMIEISKGQTSSSASSALLEGVSASSSKEYVLQKRVPAPNIPEKIGLISGDGADSSANISENIASLDATVVAMPSFDMQERKRMVLDVSCVIDGTPTSLQLEDEAMADFKFEEKNKSRTIQQPGSNVSVRAGGEQGEQGLGQVHNSHTGEQPSLVGVKPSDGMKDGKVPKRPLGDLSSDTFNMVEKKKKRKKKELNSETSSGHPQKRLSPGKGEKAVGNLAGKSSQIGMAPREDYRVNQQKKDFGASNSSFDSVVTLPTELGLSQLLSDLNALALDPFHGVERNSPAIIQQFFLRFRSLVYQKSLVLSPPSESEAVEVRAPKTASSLGLSDNSPNDNTRDLTPSKLVKPPPRSADPTKAGSKRLPSDRQEEIAAKRLKKITHLKSLAAEKKASLKTVEAVRMEGKEQVSLVPPKLVKPKKLEPPPRAVQPTMLVMKFPPGTSLPSAAELKARFGRFGSLDQAAIRVFWKSFTCRVVFRHKADAQAAFKYANGNNSLFGNNVSVRYQLRELEAPAAEGPESEKGRGEDNSIETQWLKDSVAEQPAAVRALQPLAQQTVQLKSCLKKSAGDEAGQPTSGNGGKGTPRVKFMLGGEETNRGEQLMVGNRNNFNNNASFADGGAHSSSSSSSSVAMEFISNNFQKVIPPSSLPIHTLPPQFAKPPVNNTHYTEVALPRNSHKVNTPSTPSSSTSSMDISQQMLTLLTRCNDVVTNVKGLLGYVPYHPL
ncbi:PWWP domain-containing protein [Cephalotus follicularis]|uniref:PWWP domain-containing protein n=1 Tax=Cephalotus follicularis TaxID=3775 RepID=A0A1Q3D3B7_CEPFO|nr:PWWP domain-containing protein [Cephalotus follicularis]